MDIGIVEALMAKVEKSPDGCWLWRGTVGGRYGRAYVRGARKVAHRAVYEATIAPVPDGLELDHLCRNRLCVNPAHLEPVTHRENVRRGMAGKYLSRRTRCVHGHEFTAENTLPRPDGRGRLCRECQNVRGRARRNADPEAHRAACRKSYHKKKQTAGSEPQGDKGSWQTK